MSLGMQWTLSMLVLCTVLLAVCRLIRHWRANGAVSNSMPPPRNCREIRGDNYVVGRAHYRL